MDKALEQVSKLPIHGVSGFSATDVESL